MRPAYRATILLCLLSTWTSVVVAADPALALAHERFETKIRPLLAAKCWSCHSAAKQKGGLRLDTPADLREGGDSGPVIMSGKPDDSPLIKAVRYQSDLKMPPKGKLSDAEIVALADWVRQGAQWPETTAVRVPETPKSSIAPAPLGARQFWAFQPVREPALPQVKATAWVQSPIDRFIRAGLERKGLTPAAPANRRDLIRRATFDLTGLPPTFEEIQAFEHDASADAFARVIDRLLASPRYGERWGRHWLDLARYADSNGMDENMAQANAFRYRDYVIAAFNSDMPYDQFLTEQLAGDLMPPSADERALGRRLTATGFLVLGPKMLAEDDPVKMEMDIIDEQVDTVGRVFMGLTLGCARCHDHKFDPIPTADYYGLAGVFKSTKSMQNYSVVAMWNERPLGTKLENEALAAHKSKVKTKDGETKKFLESSKKILITNAREKLADMMLAGWQLYQAQGVSHASLLGEAAKKPVAGALVREAEGFDRGNVLVDTTHYGAGIGVILNKGVLPNFAEYDLEIPTAGVYQLEIRLAADASRPVRLYLNDKQAAEEVAAEVTGSWFADSQKWFVAGVHALAKGKLKVRLESDGPFPHFDKFGFVPRTLPEGVDASWLKPIDTVARERQLNPRLIELWRDTFAKAKGDPKSAFAPWFNREAIPPEWKSLILREPKPQTPKALSERYAALCKEASESVAAKKAANPFLAVLDRAMIDVAGPFNLTKREEKYFTPEVKADLKKRRDELAVLEKSAPAVTEVMSVEDRAIEDLKIRIRGNHMALGSLAPRHFPGVLAVADQPAPGPKQSGRLELARWLTHPTHPLTARVMANRIWQGHFGEGIVRSPDNFGTLGEHPDNPELLDWLARRFVDNRWSIKAMHRLIMLSSSYQMSTHYNEHASQVDPDNRLLWRMPRRRLEAEAIRDAILAVSGELDTTMGGTLLTTKNHAYVNNTGSGATQPYESSRRAIYLPVIRSGLYDVFQAFDFADPSASNGKRTPTTVAPQALFMLNDRVVLKASAALAKKVLARSSEDVPGRVESTYLAVLGRRPTGPEIQRATEYLGKFEAELKKLGTDAKDRPLKAWETFAQAILSSSEFLYLD